MLAKPYRDRDFIVEIRNATEPTVKAHLQQPHYFSLSISFFDHLQITNKYAGSAAYSSGQLAGVIICTSAVPPSGIGGRSL